MASQGLGAEEKCLHLATALWCLRPKSWGEKPGQKGGSPVQIQHWCSQALPLGPGFRGFQGCSSQVCQGFRSWQLGRKLAQDQWEVVGGGESVFGTAQPPNTAGPSLLSSK